MSNSGLLCHRVRLDYAQGKITLHNNGQVIISGYAIIMAVTTLDFSHLRQKKKLPDEQNKHEMTNPTMHVFHSC